MKMKALIVAAGKGERINKNTEEILPKPLYWCGDKYLIEYVIGNLSQASIKEFFIVVGFMKKHIVAALGDGARYGVSIKYVENDEYEKANGLSVYKAKNVLNEPFLLSMSDHVFQKKTVIDFVTFVKGKNNNYLCTDKKVLMMRDIEDATKVLEKEGKIVSIGKKLIQYNSIDCGLFHLTPQFFDALKTSQERGDFSISGGVKVLAAKNKMFTFDVGEGMWFDVDTKEELCFLESKFKQIL